MGGLRVGPTIIFLSILAALWLCLSFKFSYTLTANQEISKDFNVLSDLDWNYEIDEVSNCTSIHHDSFIEIAELAVQAGFPEDEIHTAVAVAYAESLADPEAVSRNQNGSKDSGLWQINSVHGFEDLKRPEVNAEAAYQVWRAQGWTAWYAHTPKGQEYGSGERFVTWIEDSRCSLDHFFIIKE